MQLVVPIAAPLHELIVFVLAPRHILFLQQMPLVGALLRGHLGVGVADVLELIDRHAEGHKGESLLQVGKAEFIRLIAEEPLGIGVGELLHRHGVDLRNVGGFVVIIRDGLAAHGHVAGKGVPQLVGHDLHIKDGMVEAGEHKGRLEAGQAGHVAGGGLARLILQVHHLVLNHKVDEFAGLRADLVVHFLRSLYHEGVIARRFGVAVREYHLFIIPHDMIDAETLSLCSIELLAQRHKEGAHLLPEGGDFFFTVVGAALLQITDRNVILITEISAHFVADTDQLVPDLLQTRLILLIEFGVGTDSGGTHRTVMVLKILLHAVKVQGLAVEGDLGCGHDLLVFVGQTTFLLAQRNIGLAEQLLLQVDRDKILLAEFPFDVRTEAAGSDGFIERHLLAAERGQRILQIVDLGFVKFVTGIQRVTNVCDGILGGKLAALPVHLENQRAQRLIAFCLLYCPFPPDELFTVRLQIGAFVLQRLKCETIHSVLASPFIGSGHSLCGK